MSATSSLIAARKLLPSCQKNNDRRSDFALLHVPHDHFVTDAGMDSHPLNTHTRNSNGVGTASELETYMYASKSSGPGFSPFLSTGTSSVSVVMPCEPVPSTTCSLMKETSLQAPAAYMIESIGVPSQSRSMSFLVLFLMV